MKFNDWDVVEVGIYVNSVEFYTVKCKCGLIKNVSAYNLKHGISTKCRSCASRSQKNNGMRTHGDSNKNSEWRKLHVCWKNMISRCYYAKSTRYKTYGGRGITVCDEWKNNYRIFKDWALKNGWFVGLTIDRINPNGNYEPNNCRWITLEENIILMNKYHHLNSTGSYSDESIIKRSEVNIDASGVKCKVYIDDWIYFDSLSLLAKHMTEYLNREYVNVYSQVKQCVNVNNKCERIGGYKVELA